MSEHLPESFLPPAYNHENQPHGRHSKADVEDHVAPAVILQVVIDPLLQPRNLRCMPCTEAQINSTYPPTQPFKEKDNVYMTSNSLMEINRPQPSNLGGCEHTAMTVN